jgi:hypothetical protein
VRKKEGEREEKIYIFKIYDVVYGKNILTTNVNERI